MRIIIFLHITQKSRENPMFLRSFSEKLIFAYFHVYFQCIQCSEGTAYDVTVTSYEVQWYSFSYQWIEEVNTYSLVVNIGVSDIPYRKSREGVATPPFGGRVATNTLGGRGLIKLWQVGQNPTGVLALACSYLFECIKNFWTFWLNKYLIQNKWWLWFKGEP